uniref:Uncharacterized protein n=1 Tax=Pavo cristatus TaxID=9049 RepID=A0A8C9FGW1_PAVCR
MYISSTVILVKTGKHIGVWQCGGSVEVLPCSRIAHIERAHKPYTEDLTAHVRRNALRVAEVWMDEFKSHVYMAWNIPQEVSRKDMRLQALSVQPLSFGSYSVIMPNMNKTELCTERGHKSCLCFLLQNVYYTSNQQLHVGVLSPTIDDDDNRCLVDVNSRPRLIECNYAKAKRMKLYWQFTQVILTHICPAFQTYILKFECGYFLVLQNTLYILRGTMIVCSGAMV